MRLAKRLGLVVFSMTLAGSFAENAYAQSALCYDLESRLNALTNGGGVSNNRTSNRSAKAIQKQRSQLASAKKKARRAGCKTGGIRLFQKRSCKRFSKTVRQMERNLRKLKSAGRRTTVRPRNTRRKREDLILALGRNRCGLEYERVSTQFDNRRSFLFGGGRKDLFDTFDQSGYGSYHTVCVRSCDGYFFPISFTTSRSLFQQDEAICKAKFPNNDVELFYHRQGITNAMETAISVSGEAYASMPYAFKYLEAYHPTCKFDHGRGGRVVNSAALTGKILFVERSAQPKIIKMSFGLNGPVPVRRPVLGLDPETSMNLVGNFQPKALPIPTVLVSNPLIKDGQRVKLVGPEQFFGQSKATVLTSLGQTRIQ
ncbi:MAG: DUF2865 domain-containing protein [Rhizobiales bacterium]|nr:DUF2865 domain-containing protein [Hyphomicrobiales bacterium]